MNQVAASQLLQKTIMKLIASNSGEILFNGQNILKYKTRDENKNFYKKVQMIFQNPYSSLNPKMKISEILKEPLLINTKYNQNEIQNIIEENLKK